MSMRDEPQIRVTKVEDKDALFTPRQIHRPVSMPKVQPSSPHRRRRWRRDPTNTTHHRHEQGPASRPAT